MKVITFGRGPVNDVVISDPKVSSNFHMKLIFSDDAKIKVVDGPNLNGTYVNGKRIPGEMYISKGDFIRIGDTMVPWENYIPEGWPPEVKTQLVQEEKNPLALAGFICSFFAYAAVVGLVLSAIGLSKANRSVSKKGRGFAIAGLTISIVTIVSLIIVGIVAALSI